VGDCWLAQTVDNSFLNVALPHFTMPCITLKPQRRTTPVLLVSSSHRRTFGGVQNVFGADSILHSFFGAERESFLLGIPMPPICGLFGMGTPSHNSPVFRGCSVQELRHAV
jgi:hypothetical protein